MNLILLFYKMNTISIKSVTSKTSDPDRLLLSFPDKISLKRSNKYVAFSNRGIYFTWKIKYSYAKAINLKFRLQRWMTNFNYLMDHILYQILDKAYKDTVFHWPVFSRIRKKCAILSLYGSKRVSKNPSSKIFYAVRYSRLFWVYYQKKRSSDW